MEENTELEEGEAWRYRDSDDDNFDPDIHLAYIDEKLQNVLGHFRKDFDGAMSAEKLGPKFGGYGSFLPTYQRSPPVQTQNNQSRSPSNLLNEGFSQNWSSSNTETSSCSAPMLHNSRVPSANASIKQIQIKSKDESSKEALPGQVCAPMVLNCVQVNAEDEYAYQAVVKIGGHVFKGFLYDQGVENNNKECYPNKSELYLGGGNSKGGNGGRNRASSSSPMLDPSDIYTASSGEGLLGGSSFGNPISRNILSGNKIVLIGEEKSEIEIVSEFQSVVIDVEEVKMADSSEQKKFEIEEIGNEASQTRKPEGIQVEEMQPRALSTQGVVFDVEAVKIPKSSGQMESQNEDIEMEPKASGQCRLFLMQGGLGLTKPPKDEDWKNAKEIYLMDNKLSVLPENPWCPNLSALFLPRNYKLRVIPPSFFGYMPTLQVLNLSRTGINSLPDSLFRLVSLKRLFLNDCHRLMMLSPKVGDLKQLEVLDLEGANIMDFPEEIKKLNNLTCLEVSFYGYTSNGRRAMQSNAVVPCGVICSLSQLEELNIDVNPDDERWEACVKNIVTEVCTLKGLEALKFYFPRVELLRHFQCDGPSLSHFRFTVGRHVKRVMSRVPRDVEFELERWDRCLKYIDGVGVPRDIMKALQHAMAFFLDRHVTVKKLSDFGLRNMKQLKCCVMGECNEVQVIVDEADADEEDDTSKIVSDSYGTERIVLGSLEYLYIYYMKNLRSIWEGSVQKNSLFLLKSLTLRTCPQLTTIFTQGLLDNLCNLEELKVEDCPSIKSIVSCEISAEHKTFYFLPNLKRISLHYMPGLVSISSGLHIAPQLEWLSLYNCSNLKNPLIDEISSQNLKKIKGERSWWEALEWSNGCPFYLDEIFVTYGIAEHF